MASKDFYQILGLDEKASEEQIKTAFRKLAKTYHPDRNPGDKEAEERFKEINEAYDVLSNPQKRRQYDQMRKYGAYGPFTGADRGAYNPYDFGRYGAGARDKPTPGARLMTPTWVPSADWGTYLKNYSARWGWTGEAQAETGLRREPFAARIFIFHWRFPLTWQLRVVGWWSRCREKPSARLARGMAPLPAEKCMSVGAVRASGTVAYQLGGYALSRTCPECLGKGTRPEKPCPQCGGLGFSRGERKVGIKVPAGVADKTKLKIASQGEAGDGGAPAGDLYITIRVSSDKEFTRRGDDIYTAININLNEAMKGIAKNITTVTGKKVRLKIPAKTPPGKVFRLKGQGVHNQRRQRTGDHLVTVEVKIPGKLTREQREFVEGFSKK